MMGKEVEKKGRGKCINKKTNQKTNNKRGKRYMVKFGKQRREVH